MHTYAEKYLSRRRTLSSREHLLAQGELPRCNEMEGTLPA